MHRRLKTAGVSRTLTADADTEHSIFIKDLTGKKGIEGDKFVRIAVRNKEDNNIFLKALDTVKAN